jgi:hypothetical protein
LTAAKRQLQVSAAERIPINTEEVTNKNQDEENCINNVITYTA